ncbi:tRNA-guanine transglycosylase [Candidatus Coxiella mudrowiae]|uniref:tRNA-guanine transglycosylase n=1 Tax=Candidatus Coxiella mudrowiae TaxID=2054173 RepID=UPI000C290B9B|nr:tRNA-guanine transglycosylase [Candidatus Coxiella mudrowiae]
MDSGGFQVFSLSKGNICKIDAEGAHLKHPLSGKIVHLTPKSSIETQKKIGANIIMAFDECTSKNGGQEATLSALERTHRCLIQSKEVYDRVPYFLLRRSANPLWYHLRRQSLRDLREKVLKFAIPLVLDFPHKI